MMNQNRQNFSSDKFFFVTYKNFCHFCPTMFCLISYYHKRKSLLTGLIVYIENGWMIKVKLSDASELDDLLSASDYEELVG